MQDIINAILYDAISSFTQN